MDYFTENDYYSISRLRDNTLVTDLAGCSPDDKFFISAVIVEQTNIWIALLNRLTGFFILITSGLMSHQPIKKSMCLLMQLYKEYSKLSAILMKK